MNTTKEINSEALVSYIASHREEFLSGLKEFLRIASISTLPQFSGEIGQAAEFVANELRRIGMRNVQKLQTVSVSSNPFVYAEWLDAPGKPTVLIYGHYDVQPADPPDQWTTPPFEPDVRNDSIFARGAADDKGQTYLLLKAIQSLLATEGQLPINIKFLIEGEEEIGSIHIADFVREYPRHVDADAVLICDTEMFAEELPTITTGLRGLVYTEVECRAARQDLHSGGYGGAAANPFQALAEIITGLKDRNGTVNIPGFYSRVAPPSTEELDAWQRLPFDETEFLEKQIGGTALVGESGYSVLHRIWARPTLEVHGMPGGFAGEGAKTIIPAVAKAKISMRLVPDMDPEEIIASIRSRVKELTPPGITSQLSVLSASRAMVVTTENPFVKLAAEALEQVFSQQTVYVRCGGSIPVAAVMSEQLNIPVVMIGFGLPDDNTHAPNEKLSLSNFYRGIETIARYLHRLGREKAAVK